MTTFGIYARKSNDQGDLTTEARSVAVQIRRATEFGESKNWTLAESHVYIDDGISGAEFMKRPGYVAMMAALGITTDPERPAAKVKRLPFDVLVLMDDSRLGREMVELVSALVSITQTGCKVFYYLTGTQALMDRPSTRPWP